MSDLTVKQLIQETRKVIKLFQQAEKRKWGIEGNMIELSRQVGDLAKDVMVLEDYYLEDKKYSVEETKASVEAVGSELSDILFLVIRIADYYGIDLESAHLKELDIAKKFFKERKTP